MKRGKRGKWRQKPNETKPEESKSRRFLLLLFIQKLKLVQLSTDTKRLINLTEGGFNFIAIYTHTDTHTHTHESIYLTFRLFNRF